MSFSFSGLSFDQTSNFLRIRGGGSITNFFNSSSETSYLISKSSNSISPLEPYFQLVKDVKNSIFSIKMSIDKLIKRQSDCLKVTFLDGPEKLEQINIISSEINHSFQEIKERILILDPRAQQHEDRSKIISNIRTMLLNDYHSTLTQFRIQQEEFSFLFNRYMKPIEEAPLITFSDFAVTNEQMSQAILRQNEEEIQALVSKATQIRDLFVQLSEIVVAQGSIIDRIDHNIEVSLENAQKANKNIEQAAKYQTKSRMWKCAILLIALIMILLVLEILK